MSQSWIKAHDPSKNSHWINYPSIDSPIIDEELNRNEVSVDTIDDRVITLDTIKAEQSDLLLTPKSITFDSSTGIFTITRWNNTTYTIDTDLEKIAINFDYDDNPQSPHYQELIIELKDGTYKYIDLSALITQYEFTDSTTIDFTVGQDGDITASVIDGSITENKLQPNFLADCRAAKAGAEAAESDAIAKALVSEGYANGKQNGVPVTSESPYYHNNAEYFKDQAQSIVGSKVDSFNGRTGVVTSQNGDYTQDMIGVPSTASVGQVPTVRNVGGSNVFVMETPTDVGILPHLIVISDTGSTVTATKGSTVITAVETSTGHFECDVTEFGTWTIDAILSGDDAQISVNVDTVKIYTIDDRHFHADITVTYPNDGTDTVSLTDGVTTLYATSSPYTFTVHNSGNWVLNREVNGSDVYTKTITVSTSGQTFSEDIPELLTLKGIQNVLENHRESALLNVGDEVDITIEDNGNDVTITTQIADINSTDHIIEFCLKYLLDNTVTVTQTGSGGYQDIHYKDQAIRTSCQNFYASIKANDKAYLKQKTIYYTVYGGGESCTDYCYLPTAKNLMGSDSDYYTSTEEQNNNTQFDLFTTQANRVKKTSDNTARLYASTSHIRANTDRWYSIDSTGANSNPTTPFSSYVLPCFRLTADS